jgi:hypothetical protein
MQTAQTSSDPRARILEELRTADRLVAGALSTLQYARRQQGLDLLGLPNTEGVFDTQTQRDNASAGSDLIEAEAALRRVETELKRPPSTPDVAIQHWSLATDLLGGVLDLIPLAKLGANVDTALRLQKGIRDLFATVRLSDPQLEANVEPLADWDDGPSEIATTWRYNRPAIVVIAIIAIAWVALALGAC